MNLYEIGEKLRDTVTRLFEAEVEIKDKGADKDVLQKEIDELSATFDDLQLEQDDKIENYIKAIRNLKNAQEGFTAEAKYFEARAKACETIGKRLKESLLTFLQLNGLTHHSVGKFRIRRQKNSQPTVTVEIPAEQLPEEFQKVTIEADKTAIKNAEEIVDGVTIETGEHLRIY